MKLMEVSHPKVIEGSYFQDIMAQPDVLEQVVARLATTHLDPVLSGGRFRRILLTGMGSSLHAAYPAHRALSAAGFDCHWIETAELLLGFDGLNSPDTLLVAISQSGESAEIATLAARSTGYGHLVGITNNPDSSLGRAAATVLTLEAGEESTVSCKTYLSTLAVLHWLTSHLSGEENDPLAEIAAASDAVRSYLADWQIWIDSLLPSLSGVTNIFVTGRGDSLATAGTGGLILKESTRLHAEGMSAAAFRHGPLEMADQSVLVLIFEGDASTSILHHRLADDISRGGGKVLLIGPETTGPAAFRLPALPRAVLPIIEILPIQMLSLALAARDGFEAGKFIRASKITNIA